MLIALAAVLLGVGSTVAIPPPVTPPWDKRTCVDAGYAPFDSTNVQVTDLALSGGDAVLRFRVERFIADPGFPAVSNRGMIFVQLDNERGAYLAVLTRTNDEQTLIYPHLDGGPHRILVELVTTYPGRRSFATKCFNVQ
jgi:hypothetical protein